MSMFSKLLVSASIASVMSFAAAGAAADTVLTPVSPTSISLSGSSLSFSQSTKFQLDSLSEIVGNIFLYKQAGTGTSALQSVSATLSYLNGSTWTSVWSASDTFTKASKTSTWSTSFDMLSLAAGEYKLSLAGSIFSGTKFSGASNYTMSVSPVPEPETYAMMGVGLAVVLLRLRKKKQSGSVALAV